MYGRSVGGRLNISVKNRIGFGVSVSVARPIVCAAVMNIPQATPTDSLT
jgi:hypothetical protein